MLFLAILAGGSLAQGVTGLRDWLSSRGRAVREDFLFARANNVSGIFEWLNANARPGERVWFHENHNGQIRDLQRNGMVRAEIVAYQYMQEFREQEMKTWRAFVTTKPATGLYLKETPHAVVYRRTR